jgi:hypothetical protein
LVRYIHLNPARMKHPQDPWKYRWSSHRAYLGEGSPVKIQTDAVLKHLHRVNARPEENFSVL